MIIDSERIINGTDRKKLIHAFEYLKENYSKVEAIKYQDLYKNQPLSFILENSDYIFPEGHRGYDFYKHIIENESIPYDQYDVQLEKVQTYISKHKDKMSSEQLTMYESLNDSLVTERNAKRNAIQLHDKMTGSTSKTAMNLYDVIYEGYNGLITESEMHNKVNNILTSDRCEFMDVVNCLVPCDRFNSHLNAYIESCYTENAVNSTDISDNISMKNILERMMKDSLFNECVRSIKNPTLRYNLIGIAESSDTEVLESMLYERDCEYVPMFSTMENAIDVLYLDRLNEDRRISDAQPERLLRKESVLSIYETVSNFIAYDLDDNQQVYTGNDLGYQTLLESGCVDKSVSATLDVMNDMIAQSKNEYILESIGNKDGKPSKFIQDRQGEDIQDSKFDKKPENDRDDYGYDDDYENERPRNRSKKGKSKVVTKNEDDDSDDKDHDDVLNKPYPKAVRGIETGIVSMNSKASKAMSSARNASNHTRAIARGLSEIPREIAGECKQLGNDLRTMDENRRKEWFLQPNNRVKTMSRINAILQYGVSATINPLLIPLMAFYRSHSRTKNRRLLNEMKVELTTEIKIMQMKIDDARASGDTKASYMLTRRKADFEYMLMKLNSNSKAV